MRSPTNVGVLWPRPGIGVFQTTFLISLHSVGRPFTNLACPSEVSPRQLGQSVVANLDSAARLPAKPSNNERVKILCIMS